MFGPVLLILFQILRALTAALPHVARDRLRARWAFTFSSYSDGGLDDDFLEVVYRLARKTPDVVSALEAQTRGTGFLAQRRRMALDCIRQALAEGRASLIG